MANRVDINVNMIPWSIQRAGFELHEFIQNTPMIKDWIDQRKKPTVKQLETFSNKVHLPFGYFFLAEPPVEELPIPFFRTGKGKTDTVSLNVYDTILLLQNRQEWLTDYLLENDFPPLDYVGSYKSEFDAKKIAENIREYLDINPKWAFRFKTKYETLNYITQKIENLGIVVSFNSIVENNPYRPINVNDCRGFVLVNQIAPFLFVNSGDTKSAQLFTLIHELAHVWIGQSAGFDFRDFMPADDPIELLCDKVAAEFLVPHNLFNKMWETPEDIERMATKFKVSPIVIGRRALDFGEISKSDFFEFYNNYIKEIANIPKPKSSGGSFYSNSKKRIGLLFAAHINQAVKQNQLLYRDAFRLTGLKGKTYDKFISEHF